MEKQKIDLAGARRKRINLYKKILITIVIASVLIPMVFCVILVLRVNRLEREIALFVHQMNEKSLHTNLEPLSDDLGEGIGIVYAAETSVEVETETTALPEETEAISERKKVYLTFDDGPSANSNRILDILDQYYIKATFFVIGQRDTASQEIYKRIVDEGHTLGIHSYSHAYDEIYASKENFVSDLEKLQSYLYDLTGVQSRMYRFPGGSSNTISKIGIETFISCLQERDVIYYDWNVSSGDASSKQITKEKIIENVMRDVTRYENSVVLLHDASNKTSTVDALPELIESLLSLDYDILPLNDTVKPVQHIKAE